MPSWILEDNQTLQVRLFGDGIVFTLVEWSDRHRLTPARSHRLEVSGHKLRTSQAMPEQLDVLIQYLKLELKPLPEEDARLYGYPDPVVDIVIFCPQCGNQHVDAPEESIGWTNPPHRKHKCHTCGHLWRPFPYWTNGVERTRTDGSLLPRMKLNVKEDQK